MITIISPAKTLDFKSKVQTKKNSQPDLLEDSKKLINEDDKCLISHYKN